MTIKMKLTWHTAFETEEELQNFLDSIDALKAKQDNGFKHYISNNIIRSDQIEKSNFGLHEIVNIKEYIHDEYNCEGKIISVNKERGYFVSNTNMSLNGKVSGWFRADELEHRICSHTAI
jgi:hypothetical protein